MKKLNQKQWGMLGTSAGSMLIIVALLTMVGIGSNDTYAAKVTQCTCTTGTYDSTTNKCIVTKTETITCASGTTNGSGLPSCMVVASGLKCTPGGSCTGTDGKAITGCLVNTCTKTTTTTETCGCPTGTVNDGSGNCVAETPTPVNCPAGKYKTNNTCAKCPAGYYCTAGSTAPAKCSGGSYCPAGSGSEGSCPNDATCSTPSSFTCNSGYEKNTSGTACVEKPNIGNCPAGTYYQGLNHAATCTEKYYCPGGTYNANTGDIIQGCEKIACPENATCPAGSSDFTCNSSSGYIKNSDGTACVKNGNGNPDPGTDGNGNKPNPGTDGNGNKPNPGTDGNGGNDGTGGNGGNGSGNNGNNTNTNPSTATKTPLVIVIIGIVAMGLGTFTYYKSKNNEI